MRTLPPSPSRRKRDGPLPLPWGEGKDALPAPSSSQLVPGPRRARRGTEIARLERGVEPGDKTVDVEDRQAEMLAQRPRIGRHVGTFEQHGAGRGMRVDEALAGLEHVLLGGGDVERRLVAADGAAELAPAIG